MNLAVISVCALALAVVVSCVSRLNVGVLSLALAWIVGVYIGGMPVNTVMAGFPSQLFLTLTGVTLLFALAQCNGTLERLTHHAVRLCRGNCGTIPMMFFVLGAALSSIGPGNIATAALLAPLAMATAARTGIPLFLMAIMVGNGANSGAPVSVRANRDHRERADGAQRTAGLRGADVSLQPAGARARRVRRLRALRRLEAVWCGPSSQAGRSAEASMPATSARTGRSSAATGSRSAVIAALIVSVDCSRRSTSAWARSSAPSSSS